jgi:hypothetical protein
MAAAVALVSLLLMAGPVQAKNPPGNNGTVKIDRLAFDDHPNNQPHVGCTFQVDFYGFDQGAFDATVTFELHSPTRAGRTMQVTSGDLSPFIGADDASGGGSVAGLDASETYMLAFSGAPHSQQGYHVKLTVNAPGSQGADTKHKVFWVEGCGDPDPDSSPDPSGNESPDPSPSGTASSSQEVLGGSGGPPPTLPDTAMSPASSASLLLGYVLLLLGSSATLAVVVARRRGRRR